MRIVSLLPSATEMICALDLRDHLVGVTHECDFPKSVTTLPRVTKALIPRDASSAQIDALVRVTEIFAEHLVRCCFLFLLCRLGRPYLPSIQVHRDLP